MDDNIKQIQQTVLLLSVMNISYEKMSEILEQTHSYNEITQKYLNRRLIPTIYDSRNRKTDFSYLFRKTDNSIFIYNENVQQWKEGDLNTGGGNAIMRPYRLDNSKNQDHGSWGIPTGYIGKGSSYHEREKVKTKLLKYIDEAFDSLVQYLIDHPQIKDIYYSSDKNGHIGIQIFAKSLGDTKSDVIQQFEKGFKKLENLGYLKVQP